MIDESALLSLPAYGLPREQKHAFLTQELVALSRHHAAHCESYALMLAATGVKLDQVTAYEQLPALPVRLFKEFSLQSVPDEALYKTMTSSGTTGQPSSPTSAPVAPVWANFPTRPGLWCECFPRRGC